MATSSGNRRTLVAKPNTTSPVWIHFGLEADVKGKPKSLENVICRICDSNVQAKTGNTSNLFAHLKKYHPEKYAEVNAAAAASKKRPKTSSDMQPTIVDLVESMRKYQKNGKKWQQLTDSVTHCLCKDMLPIYTVEKEGFRKMIHALDPQYELPGCIFLQLRYQHCIQAYGRKLLKNWLE